MIPTKHFPFLIKLTIQWIQWIENNNYAFILNSIHVDVFLILILLTEKHSLEFVYY